MENNLKIEEYLKLIGKKKNELANMKENKEKLQLE